MAGHLLFLLSPQHLPIYPCPTFNTLIMGLFSHSPLLSGLSPQGAGQSPHDRDGEHTHPYTSPSSPCGAGCLPSSFQPLRPLCLPHPSAQSQQMTALPVSEMEASGQSEGEEHTRWTQVHILAVPLASCVSVGKIVNLSEPQSPPV